MADTPEEIKKNLKLYLAIGGVLFIGTIITVLVATVEALDVGGHGFDIYDAILGLLIATVKASLVAIIFMHLNHEKKSIYWIFFGSLGFAAAMIAIFALAFYDPITFEGLLPHSVSTTLNN